MVESEAHPRHLSAGDHTLHHYAPNPGKWYSASRLSQCMRQKKGLESHISETAQNMDISWSLGVREVEGPEIMPHCFTQEANKLVKQWLETGNMKSSLGRKTKNFVWEMFILRQLRSTWWWVELRSSGAMWREDRSRWARQQTNFPGQVSEWVEKRAKGRNQKNPIFEGVDLQGGGRERRRDGDKGKKGVREQRIGFQTGSQPPVTSN